MAGKQQNIARHWPDHPAATNSSVCGTFLLKQRRYASSSRPGTSNRANTPSAQISNPQFRSKGSSAAKRFPQTLHGRSMLPVTLYRKSSRRSGSTSYVNWHPLY